jgi:hypothetical protein
MSRAKQIALLVRSTWYRPKCRHARRAAFEKVHP